MEREIRNILSEKIHVAEKNPVTWNKNGVWEKLSDEIPHRADRRIFYYAAASLAFFVLVYSAGLRYYNHRLGLQITHLENILREEQAKKSSRTETPLQEESCASTGTRCLVSRPGKNKKPVDILPIASVEESNVIAPEGLTSKTVDEIQGTQEVSEPTTVKVQRIEPVVGIFSTEEVVAAKSRRRTRLHKLEFKSSNTDQSYNTIIARIN